MRVALARASLLRHRARTLLAVLGVAVSAALLLDMVMLASGMRESFRRFLLARGFQIRVTPTGTLPFDTEATISGADSIARAIAANPDVLVVSPVLGGQLHVLVHDDVSAGAEAGTRRVTAFVIGSVPTLQGDYELLSGRDPSAPDELVANDRFFASTGLRAGDTLRAGTGFDPQLRALLGTRRLRVVGRARFLYTTAGQPVVALPLPTLQAMRGETGRDRASLFMVKLRDGADPEAARRGIERAVPRVTAVSTEDALRQVDERLSYFRQLAFILGAIALVVGFLLVTTLVTVSVNERIGEFAVLRAIGVSRPHVVEQVMLESAALSVVGALLGLGLGLVTARYLNAILSDFPGLPARFDFFLFEPKSAWRSLAMLAGAGALAAVYPAWRAASLPIATTLREEAVA